MPKENIAANGDYNLSGERYREGAERASSYPHVRLEEVVKVTSGNSAPQGDEYFAGGEASFIRTSDVGAVHLSDNFVGSADKVNAKALAELRLELFPSGTILFPKSGASTFLNHRVVMAAPAYVSSHLACIICEESKALPKFVYHLLCRVDARDITPDQAYPSLRLSEIGAIQIPLPPLEVQKEIVAEIEGYQKVINGARAVLDHYRPHIPIHPDWPMAGLGDLCSLVRGVTYEKGDEVATGGHKILRANNIDRNNSDLDLTDVKQINGGLALSDEKRLKRDDIFICLASGSKDHIGKVAFISEDTDFYFGGFMGAVRCNGPDVAPRFLYLQLSASRFNDFLRNQIAGASINNLSGRILSRFSIPLPPPYTQQAIVAEIEAEQALVAANRELITRFEQKIQATLSRIWGEEAPAEAVL